MHVLNNPAFTCRPKVLVQNPPDPDAGDLGDDEPMQDADRVVVIRGAGFDQCHRANNVQIGSEAQRDSISTVHELLTNRAETPADAVLMAWPEVSVVFLAGSSVAAEYGVLPGAEWVRIDGPEDYRVADPDGLSEWLRDHGLE